MSKTTLFWSQKIKKEVRASLCPLQPDAGEEEEEEEGEGEGEGEEGSRGSKRTRGLRRAFVKGRRAARSLRRAFYNYG